MFIKYFIWGFVAKTLASFDDAVTRIPVVAKLAKTRQGRIAFSIGNLLAVTLAIILAWFFSSLLEQIPHTRLIMSILILLIVVAIYFDLFEEKAIKKVETKEEKIDKKHVWKSFFRLVISGFIICFVTLLDDILVLTPLFLGPTRSDWFAILGIYASTCLQLLIMVRLSKEIAKFKYIKETAIVGLIILAILVYLGIF